MAVCTWKRAYEEYGRNLNSSFDPLVPGVGLPWHEAVTPGTSCSERYQAT